MRDILRRPDFRLLFGGVVASMIAESILLLALAIWVKDLTGSNGLAGATIFAIVAPLLLAPIVGWAVDRFRRRPFFIVANLATAVLLTPLFLVRDRGDVWIIFLVAAGYGLSYLALSTTLNALVKEIVPADLLAGANGALQTVKQGLRLVGPLAGAALYAGIGGWPLAVVGAVGFATAAVAVALMRLRDAAPQPPQLRWAAEATAGLRYLIGAPALRRAVIGAGLTTLILGFSESLIFAYVEGLDREPAFVGVMVTVQGIGGLLGGLASPALVRRLGELGTLALGVGLLAVGSLGLAYPHLWLGYVAMVVLGFGLPAAIVGFNTLIQRSTPAALLGRTAAAAETLISGPQAVSIGLGAVLVSMVDYRLLFLLMGVAMLSAAGYLWLGRRLSPPAADPEPKDAPTGEVAPLSG